MNKYARDLWIRALDALHTARVDLSVSYDATASRAYYAAFYAVSAFFAIEGREFTRHKAVQAAVHRDLVYLKRWPASLGEDYSYLLQLRDTGDYGGSQHVMEDDPKTVFAIANEVEVIGSIGLMFGKDVHRFTAELGYCLAEPYTTNTASARVLEKAGFRYEGLLRAGAFKDGRLVDQLLYARVNV